MSADEFFDWLGGQEKKHELVDGEPVLMAGANMRHNKITFSIGLALGNQLKGKPCQPFGSDMAIKIPGGNVRYPDIVVDCGKFDDQLAADQPVLVIEVLSNSTRMFDGTIKLEEYKKVDALKYILLVYQDTPTVYVYTRDMSGWEFANVKGMSAVIELSQIGVFLALEDVYSGLQFQNHLTLVASPEESSIEH